MKVILLLSFFQSSLIGFNSKFFQHHLSLSAATHDLTWLTSCDHGYHSLSCTNLTWSITVNWATVLQTSQFNLHLLSCITSEKHGMIIMYLTLYEITRWIQQILCLVKKKNLTRAGILHVSWKFPLTCWAVFTFENNLLSSHPVLSF